MMRHLAAELLDLRARRDVLVRLRGYLDAGYRDPELLYLGGRHAASLGLRAEAARFLAPLAELLGAGTADVAAAYVPVGLLQVLAAEPSERPLAQKRLQAALDAHPSLRAAIGILSPSTLDSAAALPVPRGRVEHAAAASEARAAYDRGRLAEAQGHLERLLLRRVGEPSAVLADLVTLCAERGDVEAYERYWRRLVRVLLWRILSRRDDAAAWDELTDFYVRVAAATDRQCTSKSSEMGETLRRPGFLPRWIEAHVALVWLDAARQAGRSRQRGLPLDADPRRCGLMSLLPAWIAAFHPDFAPHARVGAAWAEEREAEGRAATQSGLPFDPAQRLVQRCLEWSRFQFGLKDLKDRHGDAVRAFVGFVARIPAGGFVEDVARKLGDDAASGRTGAAALREACTWPLRARAFEFIGGDKSGWDHVVKLLDDADLRAGLSGELQLLCAFGMAQHGRELEGLDVACRALPHLSADELAEGKQDRGLVSNVVALCIRSAVGGGEEDAPKADPVPILARVVRRLEAIPVDEPLGGVRRALMDEARGVLDRVVARGLIDGAMKQLQELLPKGDFPSARRVVSALPDAPEAVREDKASLLSQVTEAEEAWKLNALVEGTIEEVKRTVGEGDFWRARVKVRELPDKPPEIARLKESLLSQVEEAQEASQLNARIEGTIEEVKRLVASGDFDDARYKVRSLPDRPAEVARLKTSLLSQVDEAEQSSSLNTRIEETISKVKRLVGSGDFYDARREVRSLPDTPAEIARLKTSLLSQIDEAEESAGVSQRIDAAMAIVRERIQSGDFDGARREVRSLPDRPAEVQKIKRQILDQIDQAARQHQEMLDEIPDLFRKLERRGIDSRRVADIARDNGVELTSPERLYGFLKAIERQL